MSAQWSIAISIFAACISLVSAVAGLGMWLVAHRQIRVQNLLQISQYLHQAEYRDARHTVRSSSREQLDLGAVRKVCSSFDFAALFVRHGLVDENIFLEYWCNMLLFLKEHLSDVLDEPMFGQFTSRQYYRHFEWLLEQASQKPAFKQHLSTK
jgi:tRNA-dihydrouridine synthase